MWFPEKCHKERGPEGGVQTQTSDMCMCVVCVATRDPEKVHGSEEKVVSKIGPVTPSSHNPGPSLTTFVRVAWPTQSSG